MTNLGKFLIIIGIFIALIGTLLVFSARFKIPFLGRLPGDILVKKENFTFYLPVITSVVVSIVLSLILYVFSRIHRG
jgi:uncharacterized membrane protein YidH (DUF202 family)